MDPYYLMPYLLYMFSGMLFTIFGVWIKVIIFLCAVTLVRLTWYLYLILQSSLYFRNHILDTINNFSLYFVSLGSQVVGETSGNAQTSMFLLPCWFNVFQAFLFFKVNQLFMNILQVYPAPRLDSGRKHGMAWPASWTVGTLSSLEVLQ